MHLFLITILLHYRFNQQAQEVEETYDQYNTALHKLAKGCEFNTITPDEMLRVLLIFGISDTRKQRKEGNYQGSNIGESVTIVDIKIWKIQNPVPSRIRNA